MKLDGFQKYLSFLSRLSYGKRLQPARDWLILITLTLALLAAYGAWSVWVYMESGRSGVDAVPPTLAPRLSPEALEEAEALFERRAEEERRYRESYQFVDPSRPAS